MNMGILKVCPCFCDTLCSIIIIKNENILKYGENSLYFLLL